MSPDPITIPERCLICYEDLDTKNSLEYQTQLDSLEWFPSFFCYECTIMLQDHQFKKYVHDVANATCSREQKALLERGPPINLYDKNGFPMAGSNEITKLRKTGNKQELSPKLVGALEGAERMELWEEQKRFIIKNEKIDDE